MLRHRNSNALFWWKRNFLLSSGIKAHTLSSPSDKGTLESAGMHTRSSPTLSSSRLFSESSSLRCPVFGIEILDCKKVGVTSFISVSTKPHKWHRIPISSLILYSCRQTPLCLLEFCARSAGISTLEPSSSSRR
ncbi:hypothetical protein CsSME_00001097 [Camellia sinensis var. sinensis]